MTSILLTTLGISVGLNLTMFIIAYLLQTDKLTDISYSLCFFIINIYGFYLSDRNNIDVIMFALIALWATRLGSYLFIRIMVMGKDDRFDAFRKKLTSFLFFWVVQAISIFIISLSYILFYKFNDGIATSIFKIGSGVALIGLLIESIADHQKFNFKKKNPEIFIQSGLWKKLRHPNYTGEILFWLGIAIAAMSYVTSWQWIIVLSPLWIILLLLKFSGIPPLEEKWAERYGDNPDYKSYKAQSWKLIPGIY